MTISFDKDRARYPELWNGCLRAFNPAGMYGRSWGASGTVPDYALGRNGSIVDGTTFESNLHIRKGTYKGQYCTDHYGNAGNHISFPDTGLPSGSTNVSISIWVSPTGWSGDNSIAICYGDTRSGGFPSWYKAIRIGVYSEGLYAGVYASDIGVVGWSILSNNWTHIVLTLSGNAARLYVNGKLFTSGNLAGANLSLWGTGYIGMMNDVGFRYPYIGYIGTSAIYNRILSDSEIQLLASDQQIMYEQSIKRVIPKVIGWSTPFARHVGYPGISSNGVVLIANGSTYLLSGNSASLLYNKLLDGQSSSFSLNGQDAFLDFDRRLICDFSQYAYTPNSANLSASRIIISDGSSFDLTGQDVSFLKGTRLLADNGSLLLSGQDAILRKNSILVTNNSSFVLNGQNANLLKSFLVDATTNGSFILSGQPVLFKYDRVLNLDSGTINIYGQNANLLAQRILSAQSESFVISGKDAGLFYNKILFLNSGTFLLTGIDSGFIITLAPAKKNLEFLMEIKRSNNLNLNIKRFDAFDLNIKTSHNILG